MTEIRLTLCESASLEPDGTYTAVRAGLNLWSGPLPIVVSAVLLIEFVPHSLPVGVHKISGRGADAKTGKEVFRLEIEQTVVDPEAWTRAVLPFQGLILSDYGKVVCRVAAGKAKGELTLHVRPTAPTAAGSKPPSLLS